MFALFPIALNAHRSLDGLDELLIQVGGYLHCRSPQIEVISRSRVFNIGVDGKFNSVGAQLSRLKPPRIVLEGFVF
jgi:hypothetical protein